MGRQARLRRERYYERRTPRMSLLEMLLVFVQIVRGRRPPAGKRHRVERRWYEYVSSTALHAASYTFERSGS